MKKAAIPTLATAGCPDGRPMASAGETPLRIAGLGRHREKIAIVLRHAAWHDCQVKEEAKFRIDLLTIRFQS
jgi:hypothetical protein